MKLTLFYDNYYIKVSTAPVKKIVQIVILLVSRTLINILSIDLNLEKMLLKKY